LAQGFTAGCIATVENDPRTFGDKATRQGGSNAGGAAGDEDDLVLQAHGLGRNDVQ
jgi:hypothetical protein